MRTDSTCREPFQQGDEFLQYRIGALLGRGGHAFVYAGHHRYMERPVAIKVIPAPGATNTETHKRAQLEAQILSQLEHPNVVTIYDAGVTDSGIIYIVMEMLEGWTLRAALQSLHAFTVPESLHVGLQIASAVQLAHAQQVIHRDLKPENVFVLPGNVVKVLDFGISKLIGTDMAMTTEPHLIRGTPQYMSPEHMQGRTVTVRSDIYALGSVLYESLSAVAPALMGLQEISSYAIGYSQIHRMPPRLDEFLPEVPKYVARTIQRMLAKDPNERPTSMREVVEELRALQARFAADSPAPTGTLRELWHAPLLAPRRAGVEHATSSSGTGVIRAGDSMQQCSNPSATRPMDQVGTTRVIATAADVRSSENALLVPRKTSRALPEREIIAGRGTPLRAPDAMALRLADRRSSSAPVPVTMQRGRTRTPSHTASFLIVAVVLGSIIGYGALMSIRRGQWADNPSNVSARPALAASLMLPSGAERVPSAPPASPSSQTTTGSVTPMVPATGTVGATLAKGDLASMNSNATSQNASQTPSPALAETPAAQSDSGAARMSKDASHKGTNARTAASSARPAQSHANKDQLIFGAEDLAW